MLDYEGAEYQGEWQWADLPPQGKGGLADLLGERGPISELPLLWAKLAAAAAAAAAGWQMWKLAAANWW